MSNNPTINSKGISIRILTKENNNDYISLTDIAKYKNDDSNAIIQNWLRNRDTIEFLGLWEQLNNPDFKPLEFEGFKKEAGANAFVLSPKKWIQSTNAIGITSKSGRYGGTYAHKDIAMEFASWISAEFKLYLIKDYQRLKEEEAKQLSSEWDIKRILSKINYKIHTDAIKNNLIPNNVTSKEKGYTYANEADILNVALFGKTAKQWREENPDKKNCNMRDFATLEQLTVLSNLESINALMINNGVPQGKRLEELNKAAIQQMTSLLTSKSIEKLKS